MNNSEIFELFGKASFFASILEEQLEVTCQIFEVADNHQDYKDNGDKKIIEKFNKTTLGNFIRYLKKVFNSTQDEKIDTLYKPALEKRNYLIHDFFIKHKENIISNTNTNEIIRELNDIIKIISPAAEFATKSTYTLFQEFSKDFPPETLEKINKLIYTPPNNSTTMH